jgi:hypothetical protein
MQTPYDGTSVFTAKANGEALSGNRSFSAFGMAAASGTGMAKAHLSAEPLVGSNGDVNGYSVQDFMKNLGHLLTAGSSGLIQEHKAIAHVELQERAEKRAALASALKSTDAATQQALAEVIGEQVYVTLGRSGFARKFLTVKPLAFGDVHRIPVIQPDVLSYFSSENSDVPSSQIRQPVVVPTPFQLGARVLIDIMELAVAPVDLLDIKYNQALEQMLVGEDRQFIKYANIASSGYNEQVLFSTLTPTVLASIRNQIDTQGGIPVGGALISADIWADIISESEFQNFYSPVEKHEIVLTGRLGTIMGLDLVTDGFRIPNLKVLPQGTVYVFGIPDTLGQIGQYDQMQVTAIDQGVIGINKRGWNLVNIIDLSIVNARAVVLGSRI